MKKQSAAKTSAPNSTSRTATHTTTASQIKTPPEQRQQPLPWQEPKPSAEDPDAPRRIQAILNSPSYRQADQDIDYLNLDETRGMRLQIDYQKPELLLQQHNIEHTIVVFGSTRIHEPATAQLKVDTLRAQLAEEPNNDVLQRHLRVAKGRWPRALIMKSHRPSDVWPAKRVRPLAMASWW